jgi:transposase
MMGLQETPAWLFYGFCLDEHVPSDHMLRGIDRHLELSDLRRSLKPFYGQIPSVDPESSADCRLLHGHRSERQHCEEVHLNLAYRWFCRLGLDGKAPHRPVATSPRSRFLMV